MNNYSTLYNNTKQIHQSHQKSIKYVFFFLKSTHERKVIRYHISFILLKCNCNRKCWQLSNIDGNLLFLNN